MCAQVLQGSSEAMTARELTQAAINQGFISTTGKARPRPDAPSPGMSPARRIFSWYFFI